MSSRNPILCAIDTPDAGAARDLAAAIGPFIGGLKLGLEFFTANGPDAVRLVAGTVPLFLDLKLHDIPNTLAGAVKAASELGVHMLTVHAAGGTRMLTEAVNASKAGAQGPMILAVTVLTSSSPADLEESGIQVSVSEQVHHLAKLAQAAGCGGVVASPREAENLRSALGPEIAIVTPGIRPAGSDAGDQSRIATPTAAIRAGASHLVVGRPILAANNRNQAASSILEEIGAALTSPKMEMAGKKPA
jgi:orotidine-5'-phosphate decarboxylase